jgi:hypothetical protein
MTPLSHMRYGGCDPMRTRIGPYIHHCKKKAGQKKFSIVEVVRGDGWRSFNKNKFYFQSKLHQQFGDENILFLRKGSIVQRTNNIYLLFVFNVLYLIICFKVYMTKITGVKERAQQKNLTHEF